MQFLQAGKLLIAFLKKWLFWRMELVLQVYIWRFCVYFAYALSIAAYGLLSNTGNVQSTGCVIYKIFGHYGGSIRYCNEIELPFPLYVSTWLSCSVMKQQGKKEQWLPGPTMLLAVWIILSQRSRGLTGGSFPGQLWDLAGQESTRRNRQTGKRHVQFLQADHGSEGESVSGACI